MASSVLKDRWSLLYLFLILILSLEVIYLFYQNRELRAMLAAQPGYAQTLKEEDRVEPFVADDVHGMEIEVSYSSGGPYRMLFWLSPDCSVCEENIDFWNRLYQEFDRGKVSFLGLCEADQAAALDYTMKKNIYFPVLSPVDERIVTSYHGEIVPQTLLVSPEGVILKVWPGSISLSKEKQITGILRQLQP